MLQRGVAVTFESHKVELEEQRCSVASCPLRMQPHWGWSGDQCSQRPPELFFLYRESTSNICALCLRYPY